MTTTRSTTPALFVVAVFVGAGLVFMVQPMVAKLVLPMLGGSPGVWNTSMAFFQAALLAGYGYAHLLQRIPSARTQALVHLGVLIAAALVLPLRVSGLMGEPSSTAPTLWLLGVLVLSIGAPFAALSATAPLVQAWHARVVRGEGAREPYALYAASNLGSLLALLAYPVVMEPLLHLQTQRWTWSGGYLLFVLVMAGMAFMVRRVPAAVQEKVDAPPASWKERLAWIGLAAIPSSLMLGVTTHLATDVASAPFLWVAPLALYLLTFILAFQAKPLIGRDSALQFQAAFLAACVSILPFQTTGIVIQTGVHLACFFLTALVCHQALVARRPDPARLTEFYLCLSLGGVLGGAFNAFAAPVIFSTVLEYPLVLVLACLARPWGDDRLSPWQWGVLVTGVLAALIAAMTVTFAGPTLVVKSMLATATVAAFMLRSRALLFMGLIAVLSVAAHMVGDRADVIGTQRSFFGVLRQSRTTVERMGGEVRMLAHGTTLHGAQAQDPRWRCRPLVYYAPETPIGQVFVEERGSKPALEIGAVGLGTGAVAAYTRPSDRLTFFEIDPLVIAISTDPKNFSYTTQCARGKVGYVLGDARLTLAKQPADKFDILLVDAFSSDAIPAHLLTVEAVKGYLSRLKPDGILLLHLSNRHLELNAPAMAAAEAAGGHTLLQRYTRAYDSPNMWESSEDVVIVTRSREALARYAADGRWMTSPYPEVRPWTDDYMNLVGALIGRFSERNDKR